MAVAVLLVACSAGENEETPPGSDVGADGPADTSLVDATGESSTDVGDSGGSDGATDGASDVVADVEDGTSADGDDGASDGTTDTAIEDTSTSDTASIDVPDPDSSAETSVDSGVDATTDSSGEVETGILTWGDKCGSTGAPVLSGQIFAPDGVEPVPMAVAYVPISLTPIAAGVACDLCLDFLDPFSVRVTTGIDGRFKLDLSGVPYSPTVALAVRKGRFRKSTTVTPTCGSTTAVAKTATTLPGNVSAGDMPKIGVATGNVDHLDNILLALGITSFSCYEGRTSTGPSNCPTAQDTKKRALDLLKDSTTLGSFNILLLSCAPNIFNSYSVADRATIVTNLGNWVKAGGRLFVTDHSYDYVSQPWPTPIVWHGPGPVAGVWPIGTLAGAGANVGLAPATGSTYTTTIDDASITAWLKLPEIGVTSAPTVAISGWLKPWSVQKSLDVTTTRYVHGNVDSEYPAGSGRKTSDLPLTSGFVVNKCGRVIYSSYHTDTGGTSGLSAQERILEYLVLDSAGCLN